MNNLKLEYFSKPLSVAFYITFRCNTECMHCALNCSPRRLEEISLKAFSKVVEELWKSNVFEVGLIGGEPLVHPRITGMFKVLHEYGFTWTLSSNGILLNKEGIYESLARYEPASVHISLHGYPEEVHNFITRSNSFDIVLRNIEKLRSIGINVILNAVIHKRLCEQIVNFINFLRDTKLKVAVNPLIPLGRARENWRIIVPSEYELLKALYLLNLHKDIVLYETATLNLRCPCRGARSILVIDPQGYCYPCDQAIGLKMFMNENCNILRRSLDSIWNGMHFSVFRKISNEKDVCPALSMLLYDIPNMKFGEMFRDFYGFKIHNNSEEKRKITLMDLISNKEISLVFNDTVRYRDEGYDSMLLYNRDHRKIFLISRDLFDIIVSQKFSSVPKESFHELNNALETLVKEGFLKCIDVQ